MKRYAAVIALLLLCAACAHAEKVDRKHIAYEIAVPENWVTTKSGDTVEIVRHDGETALSASLIDPQGASLYEIAYRLAKAHGAVLGRPESYDRTRDIWEYRAEIDGKPLYAQVFEAESGIAYVAIVGDATDNETIDIFNSLEFK